MSQVVAYQYLFFWIFNIKDPLWYRCATMGLLIILSHLYVEHRLLCLFLIVNDISSHWMHMVAADNAHHKTTSTSQNILLRTYYGNYPFFGYCCVGTELTYIVAYVLYFNPNFVALSTVRTNYRMKKKGLKQQTLILLIVLEMGMSPGLLFQECN